MNEYDKQAEDFCKKHGVIIKSECIEPVRGFPNGQDDMWHFKFKVTVKRKKSRSQMTFDFYGSYYDYVDNVQELRDYEILSCLASDSYCPDNIDDFIQESETSSRLAKSNATESTECWATALTT